MGTYDGYWEIIERRGAEQSSYSSAPLSSSIYKDKIKEKEETPFKAIKIVDKTEWQAAKKGLGTDFKITSEKQTLNLHRFKLIINSEFFNELLSGKVMLELKCESVPVLKDMDPRIFKILIKFIYTKGVGEKAQLEMMSGKLNLIEMVKRAYDLGIRGFGDWSAQLLEIQMKKTPMTPLSEELFMEWFSMACKTESKELIEKLILATLKISNHQLVRAINACSMMGLITKETWKMIKDVSNRIYDGRQIINRCEEYNPLIASLIKDGF